MDSIISFINEHVFLVALFVLTVVMLIIEELRPRGALEPADAAIHIQKGGVVFDVRTQPNGSHLTEAIIVKNSSKFNWQKYKSSKPLLYCEDGQRSKEICKTLSAEGIDAFFISGGIASWEKDGFKVVKGDTK